MKVLLFFEGEKVISTSGIGRALKHQKQALTMAGIEYTLDPNDDFDILHINTVGPASAGGDCQSAPGRKTGYLSRAFNGRRFPQFVCAVQSDCAAV